MARDKGQILMFSDAEFSLIKSVFSDNEELLYGVRNVLLQFPLSELQRNLVRSSMNPEVLAVIKKRAGVEMDPETPLFGLGDLYQTLNQDLKVKSPEEMAPLFEAKQLEIDYFEQQFSVLGDIDGARKQEIVLDNLKHLVKDAYQSYVQTTARNFILAHVDSTLSQLKMLAGQKAETVEQTKERLKKDSNK